MQETKPCVNPGFGFPDIGYPQGRDTVWDYRWLSWDKIDILHVIYYRC
jgi:hypothetical protein